MRLDDPERLRGTLHDRELQAGDDDTSGQQTVHILGSVLNSTPVVYDPSLTVKDYRVRVGGPAKQADVRYMGVTQVNDSGISGRRGMLLGRGVTSGRLDPGDTIEAPEN